MVNTELKLNVSNSGTGFISQKEKDVNETSPNV